VPTSPALLKPLHKLVLEALPLAAAGVIGAYVMVGVVWSPAASRPNLETAEAPPSAAMSGEDLTSLIKSAHAAVAINTEQPSDAGAQPEHTASVTPAAVAKPAQQRKIANTARAPHAPVPSPAGNAAATPRQVAVINTMPAAPAAPAESAPTVITPAAAAEEPAGFGTRLVRRGADWGGKAAHYTGVEYVARTARAAPGAVVNVSRRAAGAIGSAVGSLLPGANE
jgi:hypothetical protein